MENRNISEKPFFFVLINEKKKNFKVVDVETKNAAILGEKYDNQKHAS